MRKAKTSLSKPAKDEEEAVRFLASLAARIAPALCLSDPKRATEAALRLIECAREHERASWADERAQMYAEAERVDKYGFNLTGENLSLKDAFALQEQLRKGKRPGPYKTPRNFEKALREERLTFTGLPKLPNATDETIKNFIFGTEGTRTNEAVEETTAQAVMTLFERKAEQQRKKDKERKAKN